MHKYETSIKAVFILLVLLLVGYGSANAFEIPTGNENLVFRLDSNIRYTLMYRLLSPDEGLLTNINNDDGDQNFRSGIVQNRVDLFMESDLTFKKYYGFRVSGAFWYDQRYHDHFQNDSVATSNYFDESRHQTVNRLETYQDRYFSGPYGELLDAFVFARLDLGDIPTYWKIGKHTVIFGDALLNPFHAISYMQAQIDHAKGSVNPGAQVKEIYRPVNNISFEAQITPDLQLSGQYFLDWVRDFFPGAGTFMGNTDIALNGEGSFLFAPGGAPGTYLTHGRDVEGKKHDDFGVQLRYKWGEYTFGAVYRKMSDRLPTIILNTGDMTYHTAYKSDIDLFGLSFAGVISGLSLGAEVSYRKNMPLLHGATFITSASQLPDDGNVLGPTGETMHALVNVLGLLKKSPLWDAGSWMFEYDHSRFQSVTDDPQNVFAGPDSTALGHVTRDAGEITFVFSPQYLQVLPGLDLSVPLSMNYGLFGVSPITAGMSEGDGNFGIGLNFTYVTKYNFNFQYTNYFGPLNGGATKTGAQNNAQWRDRDWISFTFSYSF